MKKLTTAIFLLAASNAYAEKVTGVGMQGYHVYQDSNGNQYVMHPTVPTVAYDTKGKKLDSVPDGYIKYATVKSDGTIVPFGETNSGIFGTISSIFVIALVGAAIWGFMKNKKRIVLAREKMETIARLKDNLTSEAGNIFVKFHKNFRPSQTEYLEQNLSPSLLSTMQGSIQKESDFKEVSIGNLNVDKVEVSSVNEKYVGNATFNSTRTELVDNQTKEIQSHEVWKFELVNNKWVINSIQEVAPTTVKIIEVEKPEEKLIEKEIGGVDKFRL